MVYLYLMDLYPTSSEADQLLPPLDRHASLSSCQKKKTYTTKYHCITVYSAYSTYLYLVYVYLYIYIYVCMYACIRM